MLSQKYPTIENKRNTNNSEIEILMSKGKLRETITQKKFELNKNDLKKSWKIYKNMIGKEDNRYILFICLSIPHLLC